MNNNLIADKNISFEDAIALTQRFIEQIKQLSEAEKEEVISSLVASENGARGLFVTYLTSDNSVVDNLSQGIINGLKTSPQIVSELLVKNVAMSTAMRLTHTRNSNPKMAESSFKVTQRSLNLIEELSLPETKEKIILLINTIKQKEGVYQEFLSRWGYDEEQKKLILDVLTKIDHN
ncbi:hypothetical protein [Cyanobacterium sp. Dongsha4]|uniref:hypothetical protein n=1 Tax=Cyanobacterium sp. DS4 TaxID=2878255 RepID=UPI002E80F046|nr:hypothetical protein [Cyanobacterium sp. Dongsha4]WVK99364.1 hypothetical protein Dongsha4_11795 [Cyanobacterium sp. Dongsha4]